MRIALLSLGCLLGLTLGVAGCGGDEPDVPFGGTGGSGSGGGGTGGASMTTTGAGGMGSGGGGSGGGAQACTPEGPFDGEPITAPPNEWTWVDVPEALCRNGSATGFGVRMNPASDKLFIYFQGGGACFNGASCLANPSSYDGGNFNGFPNGGGQSGIFDADNPDNPVRDWNAIFVPYCSGDVFAGNATNADVPGLGAPQNQTFVGYANIGHFLRRIVPSFPEITKVLLTGSSAGGFGAAFNYDRVAQAFCPKPVVLIDDAGPPMADAYLAPCLQQRWRDLWGMNANLPADCADCVQPDGGGIASYGDYIGAKYPATRLGLISADRDNVISLFFGYGSNDCAQIDGIALPMSGDTFSEGLLDLRDNHMKMTENWGTFFVGATTHTYLGGDGYYNTTVAGTALTDWVDAMVNDGQPGHVGP